MCLQYKTLGSIFVKGVSDLPSKVSKLRRNTD